MTYQFKDEEKTIIEHFTGMLFKILLNPEDGIDYDAWNDVYQEFEFKGNHIVCLMLNPDDFQPEPEPVGYQKIHSINRKAFKFYRSKVRIEEYAKPDGDWEDNRYLLQQQENGKDWVLVDKEYEIVFLWQDQKFNETQKITMLEDIDPPKTLVTILPRLIREAGEWLATNHSSKI